MFGRPGRKTRPGLRSLNVIQSFAHFLVGGRRCRYGVWTPFSPRKPVPTMYRPRMTRRDDSLIGQVVAANVVLVALTIFGASLAAGLGDIHEQRWQALV